MPAWKPFDFEKWYFDVTLPDGSIIFFFLARTRILGLKDDRLSLTVTSPAGAPVHRSLDLRAGQGRLSSWESPLWRAPGKEESGPDNEVRARVSGGDLALDLAFVRHPDDRPVSTPMRIRRGWRRIQWEPVQGRADVRGTIRVGDRAFAADGCCGYIDRLRSDVFPPLTPVRTLYWGRLHHPKGSLVYAVIPRPRPHALLAWTSDRSRLEFDAADIVERETRRSAALDMAYPKSYVLTAGRDSSRLRLEVENVAPAVESAFVGTEKAGRLDGKAIGFLARNPRGIKFFSRGRLSVRDGGAVTQIEGAPFFSEYVRFG